MSTSDTLNGLRGESERILELERELSAVTAERDAAVAELEIRKLAGVELDTLRADLQKPINRFVMQ